MRVNNANILKNIYKICSQNGYQGTFEEFQNELENTLKSKKFQNKISDHELAMVSAGVSDNQKRLLSVALSLFSITHQMIPLIAAYTDSKSESESPETHIIFKNKILMGIDVLKRHKTETIVGSVLIGASGALTLLGIYKRIAKSDLEKNVFLEKTFGGDAIKHISSATYMDTQGEDMWCQFYAFQGMMKKNFGIKCRIADLYDQAFPNTKQDKRQYMGTDAERKEFIKNIKKKYNIGNELYFKCMYYNDINKEGLKDEFINAYKKCGAICINICLADNGNYEHALLLTDINQEKMEITIETWGKSITLDLNKMIKKYYESFYGRRASLCVSSAYSDGYIRIYGFKK